MMKKARRSLLLLLILVLAVVGASGVWVWQAKRQYALNRQLIAALAHHDSKAALALVNAGADPNTRREASPPPTLPQLFRQLLRRSRPVANDSPTALQLACGGVSFQELTQHLTLSLSPDDVPLVQAMIAHGADIEAISEDKYTALFYAILNKHPHTTRFLLEHGASVTPTDREGSTALHYAARIGSDREIVRLLLAYGADPYARNQYDRTPLILAQWYRRSDIETLLRAKR